MAPPSKPQGGAIPGNAAPPKSAMNNGVITEPPAPAVNRKKAKRRAKEKARRDAITHSQNDDYASDELDDTDLAPPGGYPSSQTQQPALPYDPRYPNDAGQYQDSSGAGYGYSDEDNQYAYDPAYATSNGVDQDPADLAAQGRKSKKKKKRTRSSQYDAGYEDTPPATYYNAPPPRPRMNISEDALRTVEQKVNDDIWETSSREERDRIRQFWLKLPERDRRDLVRIEKDAVLRKMKEQQKHSCSCTVCGRKRTAIEEELEQLYDAYYKELEQFANGERPAQTHAQEVAALHGQSYAKSASRGRIHEIPDGEDEDEDDLDDPDEESEEDDEAYDRDSYDVQAYRQSLSMPRQDFFSFGENLTVKGGILTVADDLLSNQGEKFIDMMEQLANARMRRENEAYASYSSQQHLHDTHPNHYPEDDDYDDEDYDDEEESLGEDYEEEDDEMDHLTNVQRMAEGRRMFQIFAARMFEQRVLGAFREDVSKKKAEQLIAEEEAEKHGDVAKEAKKAREAEKKKQKKQAKKQEKEEKERKKEAERLEAERQAKEAEAKRQEEQRIKREEQKKKRDAEKKAQEEERLRKEQDRRRQQEELKAKQLERDRQAREAKAAEKRKKEEERKEQEEEKQAKALAAKERKAQQDQEQRERDERAKAVAEAAERKRRDEEASRTKTTPADSTRKAPPPAVALPPSLKHQKSQTGSQASPQLKVATPAIPKVTTPQLRQPSAALSQASSSQEPDTAQSSKQSTPPNQAGPASSHPPSAGSTRAPSRQPQGPFPPQMTSPHPMVPPPGMPYPPHSNFPGMPPHAMNGFPPGMAMPGMHHGFGAGRAGYPMGPQLNMPIRPGPQQQPHFGHNAMPGMSGMPPRAGPAFGHDGPSPTSAFAANKGYGASVPRPTPSVAPPIGSHSRQPSSSFDSSPADNTPAPQPIGRPAPIGRPDSVKPERQSRTLSMPFSNQEPDSDAYLGSSALLGDSEPQESVERRQTAPTIGAVSTPGLGTPSIGPFGQPSQPFSRADAGFPSPLTAGSSGWGSSGWGGPSAFSGAAPRQSTSRMHQLRRVAVDTLNSMSDQDVEINQLLNHVNANRPKAETPLQMTELHMILETEGDAHNGGRNFEIKQLGNTLKVGLQREMRSGGARGSAIGAELGSPLPPGRAF